MSGHYWLSVVANLCIRRLPLTWPLILWANPLPSWWRF